MGAETKSLQTMEPVIREAETPLDRAEIFRLRYRIYVEEMNRYRAVADHGNKQFREDVDEQSRLYIVIDGDRTVGCMRLTWGGDSPLTKMHIDQYDLAPFIELVPEDQIIVGERFMVLPEYRGTDLLFRMFQAFLEFVNANRIQLMFGDCEPHLLNLYMGLGFRTYTTKNFNSPETGYLIPLIMVAEDLDYMKKVHSPLVKALRDFGDQSRVPSAVLVKLSGDTAVETQRFSDFDEYWSEIQNALGNVEGSGISPFDGLSEKQVISCLDKSCIIQCAAGDRVVKKGNVARNMFIVLSGVLEVRNDIGVVGTLAAGDIFGEMAFLAGTPRSADVVAVSDDVRVLGLSESEIRKVIDTNPEIAAMMMLNVSKILCRRISNLIQ